MADSEYEEEMSRITVRRLDADALYLYLGAIQFGEWTLEDANRIQSDDKDDEHTANGL